MKLRSAIFPIALAALVGGVGASDGALTLARNGRIAFALQLNTEQLFTIRPDGSRFRRLTDDLGVHYQGVKSPDGRTLAYAAGGKGKFDIYVESLGTGARKDLTNSPGDDYDPAWSPDGRRIAFTSHRSGHDQTYAMNADGSGVKSITRWRCADENPTWSRHGKSLAISRAGAAEHREIYLVSVVTGR